LKRAGIIAVIFAAGVLAFTYTSPPNGEAVEKGSISFSELQELISENEAPLVVVNFWATWCGPCRDEIKELISIREDYPESEVAIYGISTDYNPKVVGVFDRKMGINYPVYLGDSEVMKEYDIVAIPKLMIYGPNGLMFEHSGYTGSGKLRSLVEKSLEIAKEKQ
jgi:thiol-disulfide isomerase/thioredoxin